MSVARVRKRPGGPRVWRARWTCPASGRRRSRLCGSRWDAVELAYRESHAVWRKVHRLMEARRAER